MCVYLPPAHAHTSLASRAVSSAAAMSCQCVQNSVQPGSTQSLHCADLTISQLMTLKYRPTPTLCSKTAYKE